MDVDNEDFANKVRKNIGSEYLFYVDYVKCKVYIGNEEKIKCSAEIIKLGWLEFKDENYGVLTWLWAKDKKSDLKQQIPSLKDYFGKDGRVKLKHKKIMQIEKMLIKQLDLCYILKDIEPSNVSKPIYILNGLMNVHWKDNLWDEDIARQRRKLNINSNLHLKPLNDNRLEVEIRTDNSVMREFITSNTKFISTMMSFRTNESDINIEISETGEEFKVVVNKISQEDDEEDFEMEELKELYEKENDYDMDSDETKEQKKIEKLLANRKIVMTAECVFLASVRSDGLIRAPSPGCKEDPSSYWLWSWAWNSCGTRENRADVEKNGILFEVGLDKKDIAKCSKMLQNLVTDKLLQINVKSLKSLIAILKNELKFDYVYEHEIQYDPREIYQDLETKLEADVMKEPEEFNKTLDSGNKKSEHKENVGMKFVYGLRNIVWY